MKQLLILTLLFSFNPKPARAEIATIVLVGIGVMVGLVISEVVGDNKESRLKE